MDFEKDFSNEVVSALPLAALLVGRDEKIVSANAAACRLFGQECVGRHCITAPRQPSVLDAIEIVFRDGIAQETRYLGRDGTRDTTFRVHVAPIRGARGISVLVTFEDLTDIEEAGKMRRDFVANVSHELKTPLTSLIGFVDTLKGPAKNDPKAQDRFLSIMEREAGRMSQLVNDLLSLSRVEEDERIRPVDPVDLCELVESVKMALVPVAENSNVTVSVESRGGDCTVPGDEGQLRQVMTNLIENAIKYGGSGGRVDVTISDPEDNPLVLTKAVSVVIRDFGDGIDQHHIPRLTERFYRIDTHRSREVGGTGLGLAIVKHIIGRHRGRLRVESVVGEGTAFTVILPVT